MNKFILCTFAFLAWGFWELSGGGAFTPPEPEESEIALDTSDVPNTPTITVEGTAPSITAHAPTENTDTRSAVPTPTPIPIPVTAQVPFTPTITSALSIEPALNPIVQAPADLRSVAGSRVNMRSGPSTNNPILAKLSKGQMVEVLQTPGNGWVKLRVEDTGRVGWMAERLLTKAVN